MLFTINLIKVKLVWWILFLFFLTDEAVDERREARGETCVHGSTAHQRKSCRRRGRRGPDDKTSWPGSVTRTAGCLGLAAARVAAERARDRAGVAPSLPFAARECLAVPTCRLAPEADHFSCWHNCILHYYSRSQAPPYRLGTVVCMKRMTSWPRPATAGTWLTPWPGYGASHEV